MGSPRRTCGGVRLLVVTEEQRYGPRWLRDNDNDDELVMLFTATIANSPSLVRGSMFGYPSDSLASCSVLRQ